jgi:hypothetical protein
MTVRAILPSLIVLTVVGGSLVGDDKQPHGKETAKHPGFERFKLLAGEWVGKAKGKDHPQEIHVKYRVTAGGSAVVETIFPGTEHEMITVIHPDGSDLLLTHYCMLGNQPHMKASGMGNGNKIEFKFVRATNLKSANDMYMHDVTFTFVDKDTLRTEWTHFKDGKASGKGVFELKRKK